MENVLKVDEYLFLYKEGSANSKKLKKKFFKKNMSHFFVYQSYKGVFESEFSEKLLNYLIRVKKNIKKYKHCVGFLSDDNILTDNIFILPPQPQSWDILFLECDITSYDPNNKYNTIYWQSVKGINDSRNFVININSIDRVIKLLQKSKEWSDFRNNLDSLDMFTIVKTFLSRREKEYVFTNIISKKNYNNKISNKLINDNVNFVNHDKRVALYDEKTIDFTYEEKYMMLPCISLVCIISDIDLFIHSLYTFLKLDYPRDKLEFLIIDDNDYEKSIKKLLPEDGRIKIINLTKKNKDDNMEIPLGNKLNMGINYAKHDIICHFFDTNIYFPETFMNLVKCYIISNKDMVVSGDMGIYEKNTGMSFTVKKPDLGNMMYTKNFWKACTFIDIENNKDVLFYNFTFFRKSCILYIPFLHFSFIYEKDQMVIYESSKEIPFSLDKLVNNSIKQSFLII